MACSNPAVVVDVGSAAAAGAAAFVPVAAHQRQHALVHVADCQAHLHYTRFTQHIPHAPCCSVHNPLHNSHLCYCCITTHSCTQVILVFTHSGFTRSLLLSVGREPYRPQNTELVPVIITKVGSTIAEQ